LKLQASITSQSQRLLNIKVAANQPLLLTGPITTVSITASIPAFTPLTAIYTPIISPARSQISIDIQLNPLTISPTQLELQPQPPTISPIQLELRPQPPKKLLPDRPEVLIQAYLAEKAAWLAQHPTIRPIGYRKARKWKTPQPNILKEHLFYIPKKRRDLIGTIIAEKAN
jgi:hypothetical protein